MSVCILNEKSIAMLADGIYHIMEYGYNYTGIETNSITKDTLKNQCKEYYAEAQNMTYEQIYNERTLYNILYILNLKSYNSRYEKSDHIPKKDLFFDIPAMPSDYKHWEVDTYKDGMRIQPTSRYQFLKTLQCFIYQVEIESELLTALKAIEYLIMDLIIANTPEYHNALWG